MTHTTPPTPKPTAPLQRAAKKFSPIMFQWLAIKSAVAVLVCLGFGVYYVLQLDSDAPRFAQAGLAMSALGLLASVQSVWSLWLRRRMPPGGFAAISAAVVVLSRP